MVDSIQNFFGKNYRKIAENVIGVLKDSKFYEEGVLTPEEYVIAGDFLTQKCPTWKWCGAKTPVVYLPSDKQYLITTVPCPKRARDYENNNKTTENVIEDDWVEANVNFYNRNKGDKIVDIDTDDYSKKQVVVENKVNIQENYLDIDIVADDQIVNKEDDNIGGIEVVGGNGEGDFIVVEEDDNNVIKTRTYDVSVVYDFYYRVPRIWLTGYDEQGNPLSDKEVKEDIMLEYMDKTVTIDPHPFTGVQSVSIHPCKHSVLLKKMIENFENSGKKLEVHMSILLFLKFLHSVVPTIQYDFTMDINF